MFIYLGGERATTMTAEYKYLDISSKHEGPGPVLTPDFVFLVWPKTITELTELAGNDNLIVYSLVIYQPSLHTNY